MGSEDFVFLARLRRRRRFEESCNLAKTKSETQKAAVRQNHQLIATALMEML